MYIYGPRRTTGEAEHVIQAVFGSAADFQDKAAGSPDVEDGIVDQFTP